MRKAIYKAVADRLKNQKVGVKFVSLWNRNTEQLSKQRRSGFLPCSSSSSRSSGRSSHGAHDRQTFGYGSMS